MDERLTKRKQNIRRGLRGEGPVPLPRTAVEPGTPSAARGRTGDPASGGGGRERPGRDGGGGGDSERRGLPRCFIGTTSEGPTLHRVSFTIGGITNTNPPERHHRNACQPIPPTDRHASSDADATLCTGFHPSCCADERDKGLDNEILQQLLTAFCIMHKGRVLFVCCLKHLFDRIEEEEGGGGAKRARYGLERGAGLMRYGRMWKPSRLADDCEQRCRDRPLSEEQDIEIHGSH
ncbi:uncharacterized protein LOC142929263 [Petromyzon marinus]|uniref:uncharacterized protein LOC142929263 n=1 Tax=Petromyzon marinus TaxID=7757 RepID=UPI003F6EBCA3